VQGSINPTPNWLWLNMIALIDALAAKLPTVAEHLEAART